ncbi:unnamed protein product [Vitrella brassicaformis CCMP3155]|uniref:GST C-terminal domain-containing protein n=2 Tax=Vitrella brassicaformis TaxID=1169539 RepID=A0A0G4EGX4_VITBC|nr:unnamed protein product [Vitrella brassicaformis CCMP3155]|eukprot:CEL94723.1 unnamed protein product [Vitrella brassicaformis CCMP3155]
MRKRRFCELELAMTRIRFTEKICVEEEAALSQHHSTAANQGVPPDPSIGAHGTMGIQLTDQQWSLLQKTGILVGAAASLHLAVKLVKAYKAKQREKKEKKESADRVVLHGFWRCKDITPSVSPPALRLEVFMRLAKIPYRLETEGPMSKKHAKKPWMMWKGEEVADSVLCIQRLTKDFNVKLDDKLTPEQLATAHALMRMTNEHFIWPIVDYRFFSDLDRFAEVVGITGWKKALLMVPFLLFVLPRVKKLLYGLGYGRFDKQEKEEIIRDDLKAFANILGKKKYMMGDSVTTVDAHVFAALQQCMLFREDSIFHTLMTKEYPNLKEYVTRMQSLAFGADWPNAPLVYDPK